jgi:hypothetical protein
VKPPESLTFEPTRLLGTHVRRGAENHAGVCRRRHRRRIRQVLFRGLIDPLRQAEIEDLDGSVGADLDVRGLEIAMDDATLVRRIERVRDLRRDRQCFIDRNRTARQPLCEILAVDKFQDQSEHAVGVFEAMDLGDVRMIERREHFRLALKTRDTVAIAGKRRGKDLDGDIALQPRISGAIHLAHATSTNRGGDFVWAEASAEGERHAKWPEL